MRLFVTVFCIFLSTLSDAQPAELLDLATYFEKDSIQAQAGDKGLYFQIEKEGRGDYPKAGDYVQLKYVGRLLDGKEFDRSEENEPFVFQVGYRQVIQGWDLGIPLFKVGSKGTLYLPPELAYGKQGAGKIIPPNAALVFDIEVLDIMDFEAYDRYMIELEKRERAAYEKRMKEQFTEDKKLIHEYALSHRIKTKRTNSGLSYGITKKGKGPTAKKGDKLKVYYSGYLLDDTLFDSALEKGKKPIELTLGKGDVIKGWEEGLTFFQEGSEGWLLIPSRLAYGAQSIEEDIKGRKISIPEHSVLIFEIKVAEIE